MKNRINFIEAIKWMYRNGIEYKRLLFIGVLTTITFIISNIFKAFYTKTIINSSLEGDFSLLFKALVIFLLIVIVSLFSDYISKLSIGKYALLTTKNIKMLVADHLTKIKMKHIKKLKSGDLVSRLNNDTDYITNVLKNDYINIFVQPLMGLTALVYIIFLNYKLAVVSLIAVPVLMVLAKLLANKMGVLFSKNFEYLGEATNYQEEVIRGIDLIKANNLEHYVTDKTSNILKKNFKSEFDVFKYLAPMQAVGLSLAWTPRLVAALYGGHMALNGEISVGTLVAIIHLLDYLAYPTAGFSWIITSVNRAKEAIRRIKEVLNLEQERLDGTYLVNSNQVPIEFDNVGFDFDENKTVLNKVSFKTLNNHTTALVGVSGSGKSTIIDLISGFYTTKKGSIRIYGKEINKLKVNSIRENISVISQETSLFPGTILENIAYGNKHASYEEIVNAAKASYADDFIKKLPDGYDTMIGENGVNLSGGERQRLAIARGFLKDAPILLLDESTANLDSYSESLVQMSLQRLMKEKTVLVIAHRLSTIRNANNIIVLDSGKIIESGAHNELIDKKGSYYNLYSKYLCEEKTYA